MRWKVFLSSFLVIALFLSALVSFSQAAPPMDPSNRSTTTPVLVRPKITPTPTPKPAAKVELWLVYTTKAVPDWEPDEVVATKFSVTGTEVTEGTTRYIAKYGRQPHVFNDGSGNTQVFYAGTKSDGRKIWVQQVNPETMTYAVNSETLVPVKAVEFSRNIEDARPGGRVRADGSVEIMWYGAESKLWGRDFPLDVGQLNAYAISYVPGTMIYDPAFMDLGSTEKEPFGPGMVNDTIGVVMGSKIFTGTMNITSRVCEASSTTASTDGTLGMYTLCEPRGGSSLWAYQPDKGQPYLMSFNQDGDVDPIQIALAPDASFLVYITLGKNEAGEVTANIYMSYVVKKADGTVFLDPNTVMLKTIVPEHEPALGQLAVWVPSETF